MNELGKKYIKDVMDEKILVCSHIRRLVEKHLDDQNKKDFPYHFDAKYAAWRVDQIPKRWSHSQGSAAGKPFNMQGWQAFIWGMLFGWKTEDGWRRYLKWYLSVARKNGKTEMLATTANDILIETPSYAPEIYSAATKKDQARKTFQQASIMMKFAQRNSAYIQKYIDVLKYAITFEKKDGFFHYVSSDTDKMDGLNPQVAIVDEWHAHKTNEVVHIFESGQGARDEPLLAISTTAGKGSAIGGPCHKFQGVCYKILTGDLVNERVLPSIFTLDKDDDWENPELWGKSNPNLDVSVSMDYLLSQYQAAITEGFVTELNFKTKNLNLWVNESIDGFIPSKLWTQGQIPFDEAILEGHRCTAGLDVGGLGDFTAYVLYFPDVEGQEYVLFRPFVDEKTAIDRTKNDQINMLEWEHEGYLHITEPDDERPVVEKFLKDAEIYDIQAIAYDAYKSKEIIRALEDIGMDCRAMSQTMRVMSGPTTEIFKKFHNQQPIQHNNHPVAQWQNGHAVLKIDDNENFKIHKGKSTDKVDVMVAMVMAYAMWLQLMAETTVSYLEQDDIIKF